jgi:hypothetical protein
MRHRADRGPISNDRQRKRHGFGDMVKGGGLDMGTGPKRKTEPYTGPSYEGPTHSYEGLCNFCGGEGYKHCKGCGGE